MKISLAGCAIVVNSRILLLNRKNTGWYELPGGKIDDLETPEQAAIREIKEELLCDIELIRKIGSRDFSENGYSMSYTWFLARIKENQSPKIGEPEKFDHFKFIPLNKLSSFSLSPNMKNFLNELNTGNITLN